MDSATLVIFVIVYLGMFLGELPFLQIDRTGIALLGSVAAQVVHLADVPVTLVK